MLCAPVLWDRMKDVGCWHGLESKDSLGLNVHKWWLGLFLISLWLLLRPATTLQPTSRNDYWHLWYLFLGGDVNTHIRGCHPEYFLRKWGIVRRTEQHINPSFPLTDRKHEKSSVFANFIVPHNIMCQLVNAAGPQLLLQRLCRHFRFSLCRVVQLRSGLVWYVSYCEASKTRSDVAAVENASLFHLISPQHLRLPAAENQLSQCSDCLALDTVWVSIQLHHTFFSLWWKKMCTWV